MSVSGQDPGIREPAVAGQFYPGNSGELNRILRGYFTHLPARKTGENPLAVIAPHAGYIFSGAVAAESYGKIDRNSEFDNIFVIGSSHSFSFDGAAIYTRGNFRTPLGEIQVNLQLARELCDTYKFFTNNPESQLHEHSLEVQLPFLQFWLQKPFRIVPVLLGTQDASTCRNIAAALKPYLNKQNLFVISTDFSHYPGYEDAVKNDHITANAVMANNPIEFVKVLLDNEKKHIPGLVTSMCGWSSALTLLYMTSDMPGIQYRLIGYKNSGDADSVGDKSRVVGYCAMAVYQNAGSKITQSDVPYEIPQEDRKILLKLVRTTLDSYLAEGKIPEVNGSSLSDVLQNPAGAFVSLYKEGSLRGCIGRFDAYAPLYKVVQEMAISAATRDSRFDPVESSELRNITIEISVLTPLKKINSPDEMVLGRDGIYIRKGSNSGTFLPQVAKSTGWSKEEFLGHCSRDKAGLGWDGWKTAELFTYQAIVFGEK